MADIEIRAFGLRLLGVLSRRQCLALLEKQREPVDEPEFASNTGGSFEPVASADALYQDPYEQETDLRFGFSG